MPPPDDLPAASRGAAPTPEVSERLPRRSDRPAQQSLLLPPVQPARPGPGPAVQGSSGRLWLCLFLPRLPLEASRLDRRVACAVSGEQHGMRRILMASDRARAAGVAAGQPVNAALSLEPSLVLEERNPERETRLLGKLAAWADRFTPFVVVEAADVLLLEIAGSLGLFGGFERMERQIMNGLSSRSVTAVPAAAPTPLASVWLARAGTHRSDERSIAAVMETARLADRLGPVPLGCTGWPQEVIGRLRGMGVTRISDCLRLPRQGFARRFGVRFLNELDRALGRLPDPREHYRMPERFSADYEFETEEDDSEHLLEGCRLLLSELERFLRVRQAQIQRIRVSFFHLQADATHLTLGCLRAGQGVAHWFDLLRMRFERVVLPAPAIAVRLSSGYVEPAVPTSAGLLTARGSQRGIRSIGHLIERLNARMGEDVVHGVAAVAEHRPQHAWRRTEAAASPPHCAAVPVGFPHAAAGQDTSGDLRRTRDLLLRRPLWMLDEPERLPVQDGRPLYCGSRLELDGPERLESGWWDDDGIARDYYVARSEDGICLWVFRDRQGERRWYLHGMFG